MAMGRAARVHHFCANPHEPKTKQEKCSFVSDMGTHHVRPQAASVTMNPTDRPSWNRHQLQSYIATNARCCTRTDDSPIDAYNTLCGSDKSDGSPWS